MTKTGNAKQGRPEERSPSPVRSSTFNTHPRPPSHSRPRLRRTRDLRTPRIPLPLQSTLLDHSPDLLGGNAVRVAFQDVPARRDRIGYTLAPLPDYNRGQMVAVSFLVCRPA